MGESPKGGHFLVESRAASRSTLLWLEFLLLVPTFGHLLSLGCGTLLKKVRQAMRFYGLSPTFSLCFLTVAAT